MVRLAIVGFGGIARHMLRRADALKDAEFVAAVEPRPEARADAEKSHGLKAFESLDQMLDAQVADAAYVAAPNKFHAPLTIQCLEAGLHVLCEKPMAMNVAEAQRMLAAARRTGRKLTVNFSFRETGPARAVKSIIDDGLLGEIYYARTGWLRNRGIPRGSGWFADKGMSGGGPLIDLGVHRIDMALWFMGYPEPVSVTGATYDHLGRRIAAERGQPFDVEDLAAGFVRFANGASMSVEASWATNSEWAEDMYTYVYGTKAGAAHRHIGGTYEFEARVWGEIAGKFSETRLKEMAPGSSHLQDFVNAIRDDGPVPVDPEDALKVQRIIDALYESAETGREVRLTGR